MAIDLDQARREVYWGAYNEFSQNLVVDGYDEFSTYAEVSRAYDAVLAPLMRTYFRDPTADEVEVCLSEGNKNSIDTEAVYRLLENHVQQAMKDAFDPGRSAMDSFPDS